MIILVQKKSCLMEVRNYPKISKNTVFYVYWYHRAYQQWLAAATDHLHVWLQQCVIPMVKIYQCLVMKLVSTKRSNRTSSATHEHCDEFQSHGHVSSTVVCSWSIGHSASIKTTTTPDICWRVTTLSRKKHAWLVVDGPQFCKSLNELEMQIRPRSPLWSAEW